MMKVQHFYGHPPTVTAELQKFLIANKVPSGAIVRLDILENSSADKTVPSTCTAFVQYLDEVKGTNPCFVQSHADQSVALNDFTTRVQTKLNDFSDIRAQQMQRVGGMYFWLAIGTKK